MNTLTKVPLSTAAAPAGTVPVLAPTSFAELLQFAQMAAKSQLVPRDYRGRPEDILLAVQLGSEVGLRPLQALQNIAVINGRPCVWGDALPALCKASSVYADLIETWEHEDDPERLTAVCTAKRHGSTPVTACFSVQDAKRAGLWSKDGPWRTYPRRMLQMRARSFALRDAFPDVLKGLITIEEAQDIPTRGVATPRGTAEHATGPTIDGSTAPPPVPTPDGTLETGPAVTPDGEAAPPRGYPLTTRQGTTTFQTAEEWLAAWAKLVRGCKAAKALDKLQTARETNQANIAAVATFDPEPAAKLTSELDRALAALEPGPPHR